MIDCQRLDKTMTAIPLPLRTSEVNFTPPLSGQRKFRPGGWIFSGTTQCGLLLYLELLNKLIKLCYSHSMAYSFAIH